ncbi:MAG: PilZ domain-containing protein [Deltaproteobacteria bacterium]|jgi:hypothetical protein|nr:PilZ domain-containing protein [Deltaproteobacteria bacterium]
MLQMNCSNCGELIKSPHLSEVQLFLCPHCKDVVVVEEVAISTQKPSFSLGSSLKGLLFSAREKFQHNKTADLDLQSKYNLDKRLARLLKRDDFRLNLTHDFFVQLSFETNKRSARLLNISSTGAAIEFFEMGQLPENGSRIIFQIPLPDQLDPLELHAKVVWSGKVKKDAVSPTITMGLQFKQINENARACLWDFIVNSETETPDHG